MQTGARKAQNKPRRIKGVARKRTHLNVEANSAAFCKSRFASVDVRLARTSSFMRQSIHHIVGQVPASTIIGPSVNTRQEGQVINLKPKAMTIVSVQSPATSRRKGWSCHQLFLDFFLRRSCPYRTSLQKEKTLNRNAASPRTKATTPRTAVRSRFTTHDFPSRYPHTNTLISPLSGFESVLARTTGFS